MEHDSVSCQLHVADNGANAHFTGVESKAHIA